MMEIGYGRENLNRNKLVVIGKFCYYKLIYMVLYCCIGICIIIMWIFCLCGLVMFFYCIVSSRIILVRFKVYDDRFI